MVSSGRSQNASPCIAQTKKKLSQYFPALFLFLHAHIVKLKYATVAYLSSKMGNAFLLSKQFSFTLKILQGQLLG
jgi:hypothetical protein